jgi:pimeloyl-ACP methyl ester carboxylesterase
MNGEVRVDGVRSPYLQHGPEDASEAVVFVHGNPGPKEDWGDLMERLDPRIRAIAPDMPGFGAADRPRDFAYTVAGYARHLDGVLRELGVTRPHFVLHDFGGPWGMKWMADHPGKTGSLTLINMGILRGYEWHSLARIWQTPILGELFQASATRAGLKLILNRTNPKPFPEAFIDRIDAAADWGHKRAVLKLYRASRDVATLGRAVESIKSADLPTLVVWGTGDPYLPARFAHDQKDYFARAEVHLLEGCGHWPFVDDPDLVAKYVVPFLETQLADATSRRNAETSDVRSRA